MRWRGWGLLAVFAAGCGGGVDANLGHVHTATLPLVDVQGEYIRGQLHAILIMSLTVQPTLQSASLRISAAESSEVTPLPPMLARRVARNCEHWIELAHRRGWLRRGGRRTECHDDDCRPALATRDAITATRDLLERSTIDPQPLHIIRAAIARVSPGPNCQGDANTPRVAVLRHMFELAPPPLARFHAPPLRCAPFAAAAAPVRHSPVHLGHRAVPTGSSQGIWVEVDPGERVESPPIVNSGDARWGEAPWRAVHYRVSNGYWITYGVFYVKQISGVWRVVSGEALSSVD
jgi:hypothetical protein